MKFSMRVEEAKTLLFLADQGVAAIKDLNGRAIRKLLGPAWHDGSIIAIEKLRRQIDKSKEYNAKKGR